MNNVSHLAHPKYRPDIDGLRAVAVLSVVFFHAFPEFIRGGFVGVDIFFVISGFLISTIIFSSLNGSSFSFSEFYSKRAKRIFPSLIVVMISCLIFGFYALLPDEFSQLGKHILSGSAFVSNFSLWNESGYFDTSAETKPLLHLWSLGIEEQFYILWPIAIWMIWGKKKHIFKILILIALASFSLNIYFVTRDSAAAFYSPITRFWELLSGSMLSWYILYVRRGELAERQSIIRNILSILGGVLIAYGFYHITSDDYFPGFVALIPVCGAVLIILSGEHSVVNRVILSNRALVFIGKISFPLYLWHWPIFSFLRIINGGSPSIEIRIIAIFASLVLSIATYFFVEKPIRYGRKINASALSLLLLLVGVSGLFVYASNGLPNRESITKSAENLSMISRITEDDQSSHKKCIDTYSLPSTVRYCNISGDSKPSIAMIGDSHARALYDAMARELSKSGTGILNVGGRLFLGVENYISNNEFEKNVNIGGMAATMFAANDPSIKDVIMVSRGPIYFQDNTNLVFSITGKPEIQDKKAIMEYAIRKTLEPFAKTGKNVIYVIDNPDISFDPRKCLDSRPFTIGSSGKKPCAITKDEYLSESKAYRDIVFRVVKEYKNVSIFDAPAYLCDSKMCWVKKDGEILYRDGDHLSEFGADLIAPEIVRVLKGGKSRILDKG